MTMRFVDVTERLGATVLNVAIPHMAKVRIWQAVHGGYSWAIAFEPGVPSWSDEERAKHVGYTASYRMALHRNSSQTIRIDGGPWDSFAKAEEACQRTWRQIRSDS